MKNGVRKNIFKWLIITCLVIAVFIFASRSYLLRLADDSVLFYALPSETLSKFGFEKIKQKKMRADFLFNAFPSLMCPALKNYFKNDKNLGELKVVILYNFPNFPPKHHACAENILIDMLKNDMTFCPLAALMLGYFGEDAAPALIEAWSKKGDLFTKNNIASSMIRIGSKSFVPVLIESLKKDKSFSPAPLKVDKNETVEAVYALIALYEITNDNYYKAYITKVIKNGAEISRLFAIGFMDGSYAKENMIPFLRMGLKDKNKTARELAKKNIDLIENNLKVQK